MISCVPGGGISPRANGGGLGEGLPFAATNWTLRIMHAALLKCLALNAVALGDYGMADANFKQDRLAAPVIPTIRKSN